MPKHNGAVEAPEEGETYEEASHRVTKEVLEGLEQIERGETASKEELREALLS